MRSNDKMSVTPDRRFYLFIYVAISTEVLVTIPVAMMYGLVVGFFYATLHMLVATPFGVFCIWEEIPSEETINWLWRDG